MNHFKPHAEVPASIAVQPETQEAQYRIPYHYLAKKTKAGHSWHEHWSWGHRYLAGIELMLETVSRLPIHTAVELGCGDGRILSELQSRAPLLELMGVDLSQRALGFARIFAPKIQFVKGDILTMAPLRKCDLVIASEVLEHVEIHLAQRFIEAALRWLTPGGRILITVPHVNKPLIRKHHQHFDKRTLAAAFPSNIIFDEWLFFDHRNLIVRISERILSNKIWLITNPRINSMFYRYYRSRHIRLTEDRCERIGVLARIS